MPFFIFLPVSGYKRKYTQLFGTMKKQCVFCGELLWLCLDSECSDDEFIFSGHFQIDQILCFVTVNYFQITLL